MAIDLNKLSAKELYELAMRKEKEEQQLQKRQAQLTDMQKQRAQFISAHDVALADIERKITELTSQRAKLIVDHEKSMATVGKEISELMQQIEAETSKAAASSTPAAKPSAPAQQPKAAPVPQPKTPHPAAPQPKLATPTPVAESTPSTPESQAGEPGGSGIIDDKDELFEKVRDLMRTRSFISHTLLKEQLKAKGYNIPNLTKLVDQLIRDGKLASAGGGNYALGKKA